MESWLANGYFLYVNDKQISDLFSTLELAQEAAEPYMNDNAKLRIQSANEPPPMPTRIWNYHYDIKKWNEYLRG